MDQFVNRDGKVFGGSLVIYNMAICILAMEQTLDYLLDGHIPKDLSARASLVLMQEKAKELREVFG